MSDARSIIIFPPGRGLGCRTRGDSSLGLSYGLEQVATEVSLAAAGSADAALSRLVGRPALFDALAGSDTSWSASVIDHADTFKSDMLSAGGSELVEFWLARDLAAYRNVATGVSALLGQKAGINAVQNSGPQQPTMQAGAASNGRDALRFSRTATSGLVTPASFAATQDDRWCILTIGRLTTSPAVATGRLHEFAGPSDRDALDIQLVTTPALQYAVHYNNGGGGVANISTTAFNSTSPFAAAVAASNTHQKYLNGTWTSMGQAAGLSTRMNFGNETLSFGCNQPINSGFMDWDLWCTALFKMSGTAVPSGFAAMLALARTYYDEAGL